MNSIYCASTIKRRRRTKEEMLSLDKEIIAALREHHPCSVRQVFYLMTNPHLAAYVEKSEGGYRDIQSRCLKLRRTGRIPYSWISDFSRHAYHTNTFKDASEFVTSMAWQYRADLWRDAESVCEVWVESRSIASCLIDLCEQYAVGLYPCGGFSSVSFIYAAAEDLNDRELEKPVVILFVGDHDQAGHLIDKALERELRGHLNPKIELDFRRIGINEDQIAQYNLPTKPRKLGDKRSPHVSVTVEAEAMPATILRELLEREILTLLPPLALEIAKISEESEQAHLRKMASLLKRQRSGVST